MRYKLKSGKSLWQSDNSRTASTFRGMKVAIARWPGPNRRAGESCLCWPIQRWTEEVRLCINQPTPSKRGQTRPAAPSRGRRRCWRWSSAWLRPLPIFSLRRSRISANPNAARAASRSGNPRRRSKARRSARSLSRGHRSTSKAARLRAAIQPPVPNPPLPRGGTPSPPPVPRVIPLEPSAGRERDAGASAPAAGHFFLHRLDRHDSRSTGAHGKGPDKSGSGRRPVEHGRDAHRARGRDQPDRGANEGHPEPPRVDANRDFQPARRRCRAT